MVRETCMPCHGTRDSRPDSIKESYTLDRAYNFAVGDLRGVFSVFVPDPTLNRCNLSGDAPVCTRVMSPERP
jgi:hypothetical protein